MAIKNKLNTALKILFNSRYRFAYLSGHGFYKKMNDKRFIEKFYYAKTGQKLDLTNPKSFNEKIQWLKLYDRNPLYTTLVDKADVKKYVSSLIGEEHIIPTLAVYDDVDEIDTSKLPNEFVIKCTHDSASVFVIKDKSNSDWNQIKEDLSKKMKVNYYYFGREWAYKDVKPRIIVEELIKADNNEDLKDFKVFCFNGNPKLIQVDYDRFHNHKRNIFTPEWNLLDVEIEYPSGKEYKTEKPVFLQQMLEFAAILSKDIPQARVDFYYANEKIYFGEITLYHGNGIESFRPDSYGVTMGSWIKMPEGDLKE